MTGRVRMRAALPVLMAAGLVPGATAARGAAVASSCSAGAHALSPYGARVYPDTGNGGYTSLHTNVYLVYNAATNQFLAGNHVVLDDRATQCLTSFSLDFERTSANHDAGPDMAVGSVLVNGKPATFGFVQPTYPGDPHGPNDPSPLAHEVGQTDPVGGPKNNPLPPACSPELMTPAAGMNSQNGQQCPANKLVITPPTAIPDGAAFTVQVSWTGRPGAHNDGDGSKEGWFRAPDGSLVSSEPVGTEDWMPLNDYPSAKPTYDFYDTVNAGKVALANGVLVSVTHHAKSAGFPGGSVTWRWHSPEPVASYLVQSSVGNYLLTERTAPDGVRFYQAQDAAISAARRKKNEAVIRLQQDITQWESQFNGAYPFSSDGLVIGTPPVNSGAEEMQTMISFNSGYIGIPVLYHENNHQWWGDNVTEHGYPMTFFKEGFGQLAQYLWYARTAEDKAGGPTSRRGQAAFNKVLIHDFNHTYSYGGRFWTGAPSAPTPWTLFTSAPTYIRPAGVYIALRQILGALNWTRALQQIQQDYRGATITEAQEEGVFRQWLPSQSTACQTRLSAFFTEWWDTAYPPGGGANRPQITGPGLAGPGFYNSGCHR